MIRSNRELFLNYMGLPSSNPMGIEIDRAEGIYLYDTTGKKYIDLVSGVAVSNIGHLNSAVVSAINEQIKKYMHTMVYGEMIQSPQTRLAEKLTGVLPEKLSSVYFVNSGSEAIEGALKLAKRYTGRHEIISFKNTYHGGTHGALSIMGHESLKFAFRPLLPAVKFISFNNEPDLNEITDKTACVVVETIQAEAGIILPENDFLKKLKNRCSKTGTLLIIDDIQMGFGRTGKLFSFEHFGIEPDILVLAKAMGGGMPVGAFISSREIMKSLTFNPELGHITTFGGHPVSCAASLANLNVLLNNNYFQEAELKGKKFKDVLQKHINVKSIRCKGLMLGIDLASPDHVTKLITGFVENGLITDRFLFRPQSFRIAPPLIITNEEIDEALNRILKSLDTI